MKVVKPLLLGLSYTVYRREGFRLALTAFVSFPLDDPERLIPESNMWKTVSEEMGSGSVWDPGIPKDRGEVLLCAKGFSPGGAPVSDLDVSVSVGPVQKSLRIVGDREWTPAGDPAENQWTAGPASSFVSMPIDLVHAFGGKDYPNNPSGKGVEPDPRTGKTPLPNIENPRQPVRSLDDRPEPAGFGPLDPTCPPRSDRIGSYGPGEIRPGRLPFLPAGTDWIHFNQAPPDQWLEEGFWSGGEPFVLENLHPDIARQEGRLPEVRVRCFALRSGPDEDFVEADMLPETVWLFPHRNMGVVIHRGSLPLGTDDSEEILALVAGVEDPGERRTPEHYREVLKVRTGWDPENREVISDAPLLPLRLSGTPEAGLVDVRRQMEAPTTDAMSRQVEGRLKQSLQGFLDPKETAGSSSLRAAASPGFGRTPGGAGLRDSILSRIESVFREAPAGAFPVPGDTPPPLRERMQEAIGGFPEGILSKAGISPGALLDPSLVRRPSVPSFEEWSGTLLSGNNGSGSLLPEAGRTALRTAWEALRTLQGAAKSSAERGTAHFDGEPPSDPERALLLRRKVVEGLETSSDFGGWDLAGADLSGLDLSEAVFSEADLSGADLSGTDLSRANLAKAMLCHANLSESRLEGCEMGGANLGFADLSRSRASGAHFGGSVLTGTRVAGADLSGADMSGADLTGFDPSGANLSGMKAPGARFSTGLESGGSPGGEGDERLTIGDVDWRGADLSGATFTRADFRNVDFTGARLSKAVFLRCSALESRFNGCRMEESVFSRPGDFSGTDFSDADLSRSNLRGMPLSRALFAGAKLPGADLSGADLRHAKMRGASAPDSRFVKADLRHFDGTGSDFRLALFLKADLRGATFRESCLYEAVLQNVHSDETTVWDGALVGKTWLDDRGIE